MFFLIPTPMQVKVQTVPGFANGMLDGFPKFIAAEGFGG
jgi:solute carrier family 25 phosphate transporter 3